MDNIHIKLKQSHIFEESLDRVLSFLTDYKKLKEVLSISFPTCDEIKIVDNKIFMIYPDDKYFMSLEGKEFYPDKKIIRFSFYKKSCKNNKMPNLNNFKETLMHLFDVKFALYPITRYSQILAISDIINLNLGLSTEEESGNFINNLHQINQNNIKLLADIELIKGFSSDIFCKSLQERLRNSNENLSQEETIVIKSSIDCLWEVIADWTLLQKHVKSLAGVVRYKGEPSKIGSEMHYIGNNCEYFMELKEIQIKNKERINTLYFIKGIPYSPRQDLVFHLVKITDNLTFLKFRHIFLEYVSNEQISKIANEKKCILNQLKTSLEKN